MLALASRLSALGRGTEAQVESLKPSRLLKK
jgi:hypothetical protein